MTKLISANHALPEGSRDHMLWDDDLKGFGLRSRIGSGDRIMRAWLVQYRADGHTRRMVIGDAAKLSPKQAREKARKLLAQVELGGDPSADKQDRRQKDGLTLRAVIADFLAWKRNDEDIGKQTKRVYQQYLEGPNSQRAVNAGMKPYLASLHPMPIDKVTRKDVATCLLKVQSTHGKPAAAMLRTLLGTCFVWAMQTGLTETNPVIGTIKLERSRPRERVLDNEELAAIWKALPDSGDYSIIVKLLILSGCRATEVSAMRESEFDAGTWTLPKERSKNGREHTLPLTPLMSELLDSVLRRNGTDLLFGWGANGFTNWTSCKRALDSKLDLPAWTHHDIRRSVATGMANIGIQPHVIEAVLNHQSGHKAGVAGIYNRSSYVREVEAAMALWSEHIATLLSGGEAKVVPFKTRL
jgi:integrase